MERAPEVDALLASVDGVDIGDRLRALANVGVSTWGPTLERYEPEALIRGTVLVVRRLALPFWTDWRPSDLRPRRAVEAAEMCLLAPSENAVAFARVAAKGCTQARAGSIGSHHRIAEAARSLALSCTTREGRAATNHVVESLGHVEGHLTYVYAIAAIYGRDGEVRTAILRVLGGVLDQGRPVDR